MKLEEMTTLWGTPIMHLKDYAKRHRILSSVFYSIDIILLVVFVIAMYYKGSDFKTYMFVMIMLCLVLNLAMNVWLNPDKWQTYKFYRKFKHNEVIVKRYDVSSDTLASILYCTGCRRVKDSRSLNYYKEMMLSICCEDSFYAKKIMKYLSKYESENGDLYVNVTVKGKKEYFIGFDEEEEKE